MPICASGLNAVQQHHRRLTSHSCSRSLMGRRPVTSSDQTPTRFTAAAVPAYPSGPVVWDARLQPTVVRCPNVD